MPTMWLWQPLFHVLCSRGAIPAGVQWDHLAGWISRYHAYRVTHFPKHFFLWRWHLGCSPGTLQAGITWAPALLQSKRQKKMLTLTVLSGKCGKLCPSTPFGSLAHFLWPLMHTHFPAHPGDWHLLPTCTRSECPGTAMEVSSSSLLRSVVLDALVYDFGNFPPRVKIQKSL